MNDQRAEISRFSNFIGGCDRILIDGEWHPGGSRSGIPVINPANGETLGHIAAGTPEDIDAAVTAARKAFSEGPWRQMTATARAALMLRLAELIDEHADELATLEVIDNGMPMQFARATIGLATSWLRYFAGLADKVFGRNTSDVICGDGMQMHAYSSCEPVGVVGLIVPWNAPLGNLAIKLAPALAVGCCCILKPDENTSLTAIRIGELLVDAGFPPGVVNIVTGHGNLVGAAMAKHPGIDKISFTGSTEVGKQIVQAASGNLKRVTLELGGKSPCIVCHDAHMDTAIPGAAMAIFANSGQVCFAGSRLFVHRSVYDQVVEGIASFAAGLKLGDGFDPETMLGPLISGKQHDRVMSYIQTGTDAGAELVTGGESLPREGFFVAPTLFANTRADMSIVREEIFGPVLVATPFDELDEVVAMANDTRYGLGAGIFSENVNTVHRVARRLEAGNVWVNCYGMTHPTLPFGGFKESGWGRELGTEGLDAFLEKKSVYIQLRD